MVVTIAVLSIAFMTLMGLRHWRTAGIVEWTLSYCGAIYIWCFIGFVAVPEAGIDQRESDPLLGERAYVDAEQNGSIRRTVDHVDGIAV